MALGLLSVHQQTQNGKVDRGRHHWGTTAPGGELQTYNMDLPTAGAPRNCPVKGCRGRVAMQTAMQVLFPHWNVRDTVIILEEGNLPYPECTWDDMLVIWKALNEPAY